MLIQEKREEGPDVSKETTATIPHPMQTTTMTVDLQLKPDQPIVNRLSHTPSVWFVPTLPPVLESSSRPPRTVLPLLSTISHLPLSPTVLPPHSPTAHPPHTITCKMS